MKKIIIILFLIINTTLFSETVETILNDFSESIMVPNLTGKFSITLISKNGDKREIEATAYQKQESDTQMNRLFLFSSPPSVRDTGFLIHSYYGNGGTNKLWIYLPIVKKVKRISLNSAGGGYFMGSDFSYADFISKSSSEYTQELLDETTIENQLCYTIKEYGATEEMSKKLGYAYIINYYNKSDSFLIGRDYYEKSGDLLKTYRVKEIKRFGKYIYPTNIIMENIQTQHKSIISVTDISMDELSNKYFTTRYLTK